MSKKLDVLFVHPNGAPIIYQELSKTYSAIEPPIWAALLANNARANGWNTQLIDCEAEQLNASESAEVIGSYNPKLVAIVIYGQQPSASTQNMAGTRALLAEIRASHGHLKTVLIGLHPSAVSRQTLSEEQTDFVCQGEGVHTVNALLSINMNDTSQLATVPGLWYREDGKIRCTKPAPIIAQEALEKELPGMAWDLLPMDKYRTSNWHAMTNGNDRTPFASLYTSLGCPFRCSFCCINAPFGNNNLENWDTARNKFRYWDPEYIIKEFDQFHKMGIRNIKIADEMFVLYKDHFMRLCELIHERGYDFNIWAYSRIDTVKEEYLETLKKAGVNWLALGIESGNTAVRKDVTKGKFTDVNIRDLVDRVQNAGISVIGNYIFGLPEDTIETMEDTLSLSMELNCEFSNYYSAMAYPGSKLYLEALKEGWELPDTYVGYSQHSYETQPLPTNHISAAEVLKFRDESFLKYYKNPKYLDMIEERFGNNTRSGIEEMTKIKLKRKILGD
jgi:anaerobic magnesium-protoporphyrin IX monomethyl ester cyclase